MKVTIMKTDKIVVKDGVAHTEIDTSDLPSNVGVIQWYDTKGDIEYIDETKLPVICTIRNEAITSFSPYQKYVDACNDGNKA